MSDGKFSNLSVKVEGVGQIIRPTRKHLCEFCLYGCIVILILATCSALLTRVHAEENASQVFISVPSLIFTTNSKADVTIVIVTVLDGQLKDHNITMKVYDEDFRKVSYYYYNTQDKVGGNLTRLEKGVYIANFSSNIGIFHILANTSCNYQGKSYYGLATASFVLYKDASERVDTLEGEVKKQSQSYGFDINRISTAMNELNYTIKSFQSDLRLQNNLLYIVLILSGVALAISLGSLTMVMMRRRELEELFAVTSKDIVVE